MPKVSVIIPVYNTERYLKRCLDSVCNQTLSDIEIICINDCSTDNSLDILKEYADKDKRIKIINFKENKGAAVARNTGIDIVKGEYIGFIDSDDFVDLDFYEKLYDKANKTYADAVKGNVYDYDVNSGKSVLTDFYNMNDKINKNKAYFCYGFTSAIYKTSFINKYNINFPDEITHFEDPYFSIKASLYYNILEIEEKANYYYTKRNDSVCSSYSTTDGINNFCLGVKTIMSMINNIETPKDDYLIRITFLLERVIPFCNNTTLTTTSIKEVVKVLSDIFMNSKLPINDVLTDYFLLQKSNFIRQQIRMIRKKRSK